MSHSMIVKEATDYIEKHLDEDLPLDKIAKALNYSKFYLSRVFHEETKCTIYKYIQGRRLTLAAKKLVETEKPIVEIAYEAHYNSRKGHLGVGYGTRQLYVGKGSIGVWFD